MTDAFQLLPGLAADEYAALKADIAAHGVRVPVVVDAESGVTIDGHHRVRIVDELRAEGHRIPDYPRQVVRFADDEERAGFALAANLFRRHLTKRQRAELAVTLRARGWSERRIAEALGIGAATVHRDLGTAPDGAVPERITGKDGRSQPARRPPALFAANRRQAERAQAALVALPPGRAPTSILRAETMAREATWAAHRVDVAEGASRLAGPAYELRVGDLREVWDDLPDGSIDAVVTDPPYDEAGIPIFGDLAQLAARVLRPGRLAAIYCGHLQLDEEMRLLAEGGLTYVWHGVNVLPGRHTKLRTRKVNGRHRSVLLFSAGPYEPRRWIHDVFFAEGHGGPETRPLHKWQQAIEPVQHWVEMVSEPGETVFDPFCGSGTTGVAALESGRRFLGGDIDPGHVTSTDERLRKSATGR